MEATQEPAGCASFFCPGRGRRLYGGREYRSLLLLPGPTEAAAAAGGHWEGRPAGQEAKEAGYPSQQKWVALLRRLDRHGVAGGGKRRGPQFRYDPVSYALNFDTGAADAGHQLPFREGSSPAKDSCI